MSNPRDTLPVVNAHGDVRVEAGHGHGIDIASQRADDLDERALTDIRERRALQGKVSAADVGCGQGAQALRMARAGATVVALDLVPAFAPLVAQAQAEGLALTGVVGDLRDADRLLPAPIDVIVCQRTIHYLSHLQAIRGLEVLGRRLPVGGRLYVSASGIDSELGDGYEGRGVPHPVRYAPLAPAMADKHNIRGPVCLYNEAELAATLILAGLAVQTVYRSAFGNIKAVAWRRNAG